MNEKIKPLLKQLLIKNNMQSTITLIDQGANKQELLESFEQVLMKTDPRLKWRNLNNLQENADLSVCNKKALPYGIMRKLISRNPSYLRIYQLILLFDQENCGCN